jgi:hypothetical protein
MKNLILLIVSLALFACSGAVPEEPSARVEQQLCYGPPGNQASGLTVAPAAVQRAHQLVNKMWGSWPKPPAACPGAWYCGVIVPNTCTANQCAAGQCVGWTCQMTAIVYAADGLRLATTVGGADGIPNGGIDAMFATQPNAGGLSTGETAELGAARLVATVLDDFWCDP